MKRFFHSLKFRILLPVLLMALGITLVLTIVISEAYTSTILSQEEEKTQASFSIIGGAMDAALHDAQSAATLTMMNTDIMHYALRTYRTDLEMVHSRQNCINIFSTTISQQPYLYGLLVMRSDGSMFGVLPYRNYFIDETANNTFFDQETMDRILKNSGTVDWICDMDADQIYGFSLGDRKPSGVILGVCRYNAAQYGFFYSLVLIDPAALKGHLELLSDGISALYLMTKDGTQLVSAGEGSGKALVSPKTLFSSEKNGRVILAENKERIYTMGARIPGTGWYLMKEMPMAFYDRTVRNLQLTVWVTAAAVLLLFLFVYSRWLRKFINNFASLKKGLMRTKEGELSARLDDTNSINEFEEIRVEFNTMNQSLEELMETARKMEHSQLELQMRNLQTQLSPHMIFNSITAIRWMSTMLGADSVSDMLMELSEMLRPVLREWRLQWTLGEELEHLKHYTRLLDLRFKNRFRLECHIPEEYYGILLPRFTIQPLVENACEHGGHPRDALVVKIDAAVTEDRMRLTVQNNGKDITDEEIARIREIMASDGRAKNIGLYNVYSRLAICMGKESTLDIERPAEGGTRVIICWRISPIAIEGAAGYGSLP
ncbi:MAG: histidine kinase [Clostridia bacterium]|nr:histidine kinase [Clostridia bacterium]